LKEKDAATNEVRYEHGQILGIKLPTGIDIGHVNEWLQVITKFFLKIQLF
jgi:hypothetical protein